MLDASGGFIALHHLPESNRKQQMHNTCVP
jgi:hypothetical protein